MITKNAKLGAILVCVGIIFSFISIITAQGQAGWYYDKLRSKSSNPYLMSKQEIRIFKKMQLFRNIAFYSFFVGIISLPIGFSILNYELLRVQENL